MLNNITKNALTWEAMGTFDENRHKSSKGDNPLDKTVGVAKGILQLSTKPITKYAK